MNPFLKGKPGDNELLSEMLGEHKRQFGRAPHMSCADRLFFGAENEKTAHSQGVKRVSIVQSGHRSAQRRQQEKKRWFRGLQRFRAGIEGIISGLMRGLVLKRCLECCYVQFEKDSMSEFGVCFAIDISIVP